MAKRTESYMTPADIESAGETIYGPNWRAAMAEHMGIDPSLIWRYMTLKVVVPKTFALALRAFERLRREGHALPSVEPITGEPEPIARAYTRHKPKITRAEAKERMAKRRKALTPP